MCEVVAGAYPKSTYSDVGELPKGEFRERKDEATPVGDFFRYLLDNS